MTHSEYKRKLKAKCKETGYKIKPKETYVNAYTPILHKCYDCGMTWRPVPRNLLNVGSACPCNRRKPVKPDSYFIKRLTLIGNGKFEFISLDPDHKKAHLKCIKCLTIRHARVQNVLRGAGCRICADADVHKTKNFAYKGHIFKIQGYEHFAIRYLNTVKNVSLSSILTEVQNRKIFPRIAYQYKGVSRIYHPDLFIPETNTVIEVKSSYTLHGKSLDVFDKNKAKYLACKVYGYKVKVLVFSSKGVRIKLPKHWYKLNLTEIQTLLENVR